MYARTLPIGRAVAVALSLHVAFACQNGPAGLHAELQGEYVRGVDYSRLEVRVYRDGSEPISTTTLEGDGLPGLPYKMNFMPGPKTPVGSEVRLVAELSLNGTLVSRAEGLGFLRKAGGGTLTLAFTALEKTADNLPPDDSVPQDPAKLPNGQVCATGDQCRTGFCAQGRCCNEVCNGACGTCDMAGKEGSCSPHVEGAPGAPSCTPFLCDGTNVACPTRCDTNADCAEAAFCDDGRCVAKRAAGQACVDNNQCANALCVDKVCCKSTCGLACDVCQAGTGNCVAAPARSPGDPSCAPFTCNGTSTSCATTCNNSADCAQPDFGCREGTCVPRLQTFKDNFDSNALPAAKWPTQTRSLDVAFAATGGELRLVAGGAGSLDLAGPLTFDARSSGSRIELKSATGLSIVTVFRHGLRRSNGSQVYFELHGGNLNVGRTDNNGEDSILDGVTYNPQAHRWLRIRESNGSTFFEGSPDGTNFTSVIPARNNLMPMDSVGVFFTLGTAAAATFVFDNLNVP